MPLQLYPYNKYVLYFSLVLVLLFIIILTKKIFTLFKTLKELKPHLDDIEMQTKLIEIKSKSIQEKKQEDQKKNKYLKILLPIVLTIHSIYKKDDELSGVSGYVKATNRYFHQQSEEKKLLARLKRNLSK